MKKLSVFSFQFFLWLISFFVVIWLWDNWFLPGPHGLYHWVGMDFASYWVGVREVFQGGDPYSRETTLKIQELVYGGPALGEDPMLFSYPAWLFIFIVPFALLPYQWASILWVSILLWAVLNFFLKIGSILGGNRSHNQLFWTLSLFFGSLPFLLISVIKGQLGTLGLLSLFFSYRLFKQKPALAGFILCLALIKPTVTVVPVIVFFIWAFLQKNIRFIFSFFSGIAFMLVTSLLVIGNWLPGYLQMLDQKVSIEIFWSLDILWFPWNVFYAAIFISVFVSAWYFSLKRNSDDWFFASILVGVGLTPMRWIYDLFLGIIILSSKRVFLPHQIVLVGVSIFLPWSLVLVPETIRWNVAILGFPIVWLLTFVILNFKNGGVDVVN